MSYDSNTQTKRTPMISLNPFGTGQCLTTKSTSLYGCIFVSIPLEQGNVLRQAMFESLAEGETVSIPLEQGNVLRLQ